MPDKDLAKHLRDLTEPQLADVLRRRPDASHPPAPADIRQLVQRLLQRGSIMMAAIDLDQDAVLVALAVHALGGRATRDAVIELFNADPVLVDAAFDRLTGAALAWPREDGYEVSPKLAEHWQAPLGLGRTVHTLLGELHIDRCREFAIALGVPLGNSGKSELIQQIADVLSDPAELSVRMDTLSPQARHLIDRLCTEAPVVRFDPHARNVVTELLQNGLLVQTDYLTAELPAEIGIVVNPPASRHQLTGPPAPPVVPVDPADLSHASAGAAHEVLAAVTSLLDDAEHTPIAQIKSGGVGTREQKRLAKTLRCTESDVAMWIDLANAAGLLDIDDVPGKAFVPTDRFDEWRDQDPGTRWLALARAWYSLRHSPTDRLSYEGKPVAPPMLLRTDIDPIRRALLRFLSSIDGAAPFAEALDWYCPMTGFPPDFIAEKSQVIAAEATRLGLIAHGALTPLGHAMLTNDVDLAKASLPEVRQSVSLQSDLTAVVAGDPTRAVLDVLRQLAEPETPNTWRFTPDTVRRAFDSGMTAQSVLSSLAAIAPRGVPQPLEYLVNDVARRHGQIRAVAAGCCVVTDEAQAAEILATRSLRDLALRQIAPTVLLTTATVSSTLAALRSAGFTPVGERANGAVLIERPKRHRSAREDQSWMRTPADPAGLAARILAAEFR